MASLRGGLMLISAFLVTHVVAQSCTDLGNTGTAVKDSVGRVYELGCMEDLYHIGDLGGVQTASFSACIDACRTNSQCKAVSYGYGTCWLKSLPTDPTVRPAQSSDMDSAWVQGSFDRTCAQLGGTGATMQDNAGNTYQLGCKEDLYHIGDLGGVQTASFSACVDACHTNSQCKAVSYGYGWCWLKTVDPNTPPSASNDMDMAWRQGSYPSQSQASSTTTSTTSSTATLTAAPTGCSTYTTSDGSQYQIWQNMDWNGNIPNYASAQACTEACMLTPACKNAVWDTPDKICYMKGDQVTSASNSNCYQIKLIKRANPVTSVNYIGGKWSSIINTPVVGAAAAVVPAQPYSNRVLLWSANADITWGTRTGLTQFADYNYASGAVSNRSISNTGHDMFCPGISHMADGRVIVTGGADAAKLARGYQASTLLSNGKVFTIGGSWSGGTATKNGEIYDPSANTWTLLSGADASKMATADSVASRRDNHAWLHSWSDGSVFQAGPSRQMNWYTTAGSGSVTGAGSRNATNDAMCAGNVMYDTGKILAAGGTLVYDDSPGVSTSYIISIGKVGQPVQTEKIQDMKYSRAFANVVVLPDGTSVVLGGQKRSRQFTDIESTVYPELFNPTTKSWAVMNPQQVPRNYHASAVLLDDGTVLSAGGGLCTDWNGNDEVPNCDPSADHANAEIWSPPYLFNKDGSLATRPTFSSIATSNDGNGNWVRAGGSLNVKTSNGAMTFSLIRIGSATHSVNTDQRRLSLTATQSDGAWSMKLPSDSGILIPGYWFLFAMNQQGTPSMGRVIQVRL